MDKTEDMNIKIQKGSVDGVTKNTGSARGLVDYINHEDEQRINEGLEPIPFTDPDGTVVSDDDVVNAIDGNAKGLSPDDIKFYHLVVSPSQSEILAMGEDEKKVYRNALIYMKLSADAYAKNYHREGINDDSDIVIYWKPHFTRGDKGDLQFHIHGIISRRSSGMHGKKQNISPLTNHRDTSKGPVKGGFDRKEFFRTGEKLFDQLFQYERQVCESFDYQNAMAHGTAEEKKAQIDKQMKESEAEVMDSVAEGIARRRKNLKNKAEIEEIAKILGGESVDMVTSKKDVLASALDAVDLKNTVLNVFTTASTRKEVFFALAAKGITCTLNESADGVEGFIIEKRGMQIKSEEIMSKKEHIELLNNIERVIGHKSAYKVREQRAQEEMKPKVSQHSKGKGIGR